jgi:CRISPR-associated protein Cmr6
MSKWNEYQAPNLGLLFYRRIYNEDFVKGNLKIRESELVIDVTKDHKPNPFNAFYDVLYNKRLTEFAKIENSVATETFKLKTIYPGLLCGSGYAHDTKAMGDFKIGFFFDHTSGQPIIPGSSVKGVCRSVFEMDKGKKTGDKSIAAVCFILNEILVRQKENKEFKYQEKINEILKTLSDKLNDSAETKKKLKFLVEQIFGKIKVKGCDIFFDAVLDIDINNSKPFLANDFITPHKNAKGIRELDPFSNPNPIQFLKVRSEIPFEFRFKLIDTNDLWTKEVKLEFFKQTLLTLGIGAKTNVGYGQFVPAK